MPDNENEEVSLEDVKQEFGVDFTQDQQRSKQPGQSGRVKRDVEKAKQQAAAKDAKQPGKRGK